MSIKARKNITEYWLNYQFGGKYKWKTFEHNGVMFPSEYEVQNIPIIYDGYEIMLDKKNEEIAFLYAKYIDSDYAKAGTFNRNFWKDWRNILGKNHQIKSFDKLDFTQMKNHLDIRKEKHKTCEKRKAQLEKIKQRSEKYSTAKVDGNSQPVGNFRMEPPGIFLGRGKNPKLGKIKRRVYPEDITLNLGRDAKIPELPKELSNHRWGKIIHDRTVEWLASWKDNITGKTKYVRLGASSEFKSDSDKSKFDLARKLKRKIKRIRDTNIENMASDDKIKRQIATATYFIDKLALRVGNEKGKGETDTVGVSSLRVEHISFGDDNAITLDFLGKDSIRYFNKIRVDPLVYINLKEFVKGKNKSDMIFGLVNPSHINRYLQEFMKGLTAKVFRTYNASIIFQKELNKISRKTDGAETEFRKCLILDEFSKANAKVAQVMNHQKNVSKSYKGQLEKIGEQIKNIQKRLRNARKSKRKNPETIKKLEAKLKSKKSKKQVKKDLKNISLDTSKANYIDPRITVAFFKLHDVPIEKVFSSALRKKFKWAFDVDKSYVF